MTGHRLNVPMEGVNWDFEFTGRDKRDTRLDWTEPEFWCIQVSASIGQISYHMFTNRAVTIPELLENILRIAR
jgi:hypothetical protein